MRPSSEVACGAASRSSARWDWYMASMRTKSSSVTTTQSLGSGWSRGGSRESGGPPSVLLALWELLEWQELRRAESLDGAWPLFPPEPSSSPAGR
ncbi:hypothetical protein EYF80_020329 [Liparis tanakae]|uniref:Uncharacterized protein n=1 Tax=Liparis tanakae TaxID=230148 RepID=A0A4Z2HW17_9TELE|nr:hypothetical protein EYF80_020329 [Liparis tanakae]